MTEYDGVERSMTEQRIYDRCLERVRQLEAENAKLRELVRDMLETLYWGDYYLKQTGRTFQPSRYETRMRELGCEVDE